jgi:hypothetical protein
VVIILGNLLCYFILLHHRVVKCLGHLPALWLLVLLEYLLVPELHVGVLLLPHEIVTFRDNTLVLRMLADL